MIYADTKIYKNNQTSIPTKIWKDCHLGSDDIVEWFLDDDGKVTLTFRKKVTFNQMRGSIKLNNKTNAVDLEKELYKWENYCLTLISLLLMF